MTKSKSLQNLTNILFLEKAKPDLRVTLRFRGILLLEGRKILELVEMGDLIELFSMILIGDSRNRKE
jgi:hypothetical protein